MDWGTTPEYLNEQWTEELLLLMMTKRAERIRRTVNDDKNPATDKWTRVTDIELFRTMGVVPTIVPRKKT